MLYSIYIPKINISLNHKIIKEKQIVAMKDNVYQMCEILKYMFTFAIMTLGLVTLIRYNVLFMPI